jgi:23S rRNA (pseudouridine1915-N3)-methyltransferase
MRITIVAVGKLRQSIFSQLYGLYAKRLRWELRLREIEPHNSKNIKEQQRHESARLLALIPNGAQIIILDENGETLSSSGLASWIDSMIQNGSKDICIVIGGANGLDLDIFPKSNLILALGRLTWPHLMVRGMIIEQIYRVQQILSGHPYHKD